MSDLRTPFEKAWDITTLRWESSNWSSVRVFKQMAIGVVCLGCGKPLIKDNWIIADGCPCNSPRGINHGLVPTEVCTCPICDPASTGSTRYRSILDVDEPVIVDKGTQ